MKTYPLIVHVCPLIALSHKVVTELIDIGKYIHTNNLDVELSI